MHGALATLGPWPCAATIPLWHNNTFPARLQPLAWLPSVRNRGPRSERVAFASHPIFPGSSAFSGKRLADPQEEVLVVAESIGHPFDDFYLVVYAFKNAGVEGALAVCKNAIGNLLRFANSPWQKSRDGEHEPFGTGSRRETAGKVPPFSRFRNAETVTKGRAQTATTFATGC